MILKNGIFYKQSKWNEVIDISPGNGEEFTVPELQSLLGGFLKAKEMFFINGALPPYHKISFPGILVTRVHLPEDNLRINWRALKVFEEVVFGDCVFFAREENPVSENKPLIFNSIVSEYHEA